MKATIFLFIFSITSALSAQVGVVSNIHGSVFNISTNKLLTLGDKLHSDDVIRSYPGGHLSISTNSKSAFHISSETRIKLIDENSIILQRGNIWASSFNKSKKIIYTQKSKVQFVSGNFLIQTDDFNPDSYVSMNGSAFITNSQNQSVQIKQREFSTLNKGIFSVPSPVTLNKYSESRSHFAHVKVEMPTKRKETISVKTEVKREIASVAFIKTSEKKKIVKKKLTRAKILVHGKAEYPKKKESSISAGPEPKKTIDRQVSSTPEAIEQVKKPEFSIDGLVQELKDIR